MHIYIHQVCQQHMDLQQFVLHIFSSPNAKYLTDKSCHSLWLDRENLDVYDVSSSGAKTKINEENIRNYGENLDENWKLMDLIQEPNKRFVALHGDYFTVMRLQDCLSAFLRPFSSQHNYLYIFLNHFKLLRYNVTDLSIWIPQVVKYINYKYTKLSITTNKNIDFWQFFLQKIQENYTKCIVVIKNFSKDAIYLKSMYNLPENIFKFVTITADTNPIRLGNDWLQLNVHYNDTSFNYMVMYIMMPWLLFFINLILTVGILYIFFQYQRRQIKKRQIHKKLAAKRIFYASMINFIVCLIASPFIVPIDQWNFVITDSQRVVSLYFIVNFIVFFMIALFSAPYAFSTSPEWL